MPSLELADIISIKTDDIFTSYTIFVESGTFQGETIFKMSEHFDELHTIEVKEEFYQNVKSRYSGDKISFHLGDSPKVLDNLVGNLEKNAIFFLDGHWSAGNTGKGEKDCPLLEEVAVIMAKFKHEAIIIIDDYRLFGEGPNKGTEIVNWEDIEKDKIVDLVKERSKIIYHLPSSLHPEDRLIIHLEKMPQL